MEFVFWLTVIVGLAYGTYRVRRRVKRQVRFYDSN